MIPVRREDRELLDDPSEHAEDLAANLRDIRLLNRWFGGTSVIRKEVRKQAARLDDVALLDVATGSADIPLALYRDLSRHHSSVSIAALDVSPEVLSEARAFVDPESVELSQADARHLPFPDRSFDIVTCSQSLHHFSFEDARLVLAEMWRVTRGSVIVMDIYRSRLGYALVWLLTRLTARNHVTRYDAPLSVLRAYTPAEMRELARSAGIPNVEVGSKPFFRQLLTAGKNTDQRSVTTEN